MSEKWATLSLLLLLLLVMHAATPREHTIQNPYHAELTIWFEQRVAAPINPNTR